MSETSRISLLNTDKEQQIATCINSFLFQKVWNEPVSEFRANVVPQVVSERSVKGNICVYGTDMSLPTTDIQYYLYAVSRSVMWGVNFPKEISHKWISLDELCTKYDILIHVYHTTGLMMSKSHCYIYKLLNNNGYLIAVAKKASDKLIDYSEKNNIRLTVYFDSDITDKIEINSYYVPNKDNNYSLRNQIMKFIRSCDHDGVNHTTVYINGQESTIVNESSIPLESYVDVIHDENIKFTFDVDLTDPIASDGFLSEMDKTYKQIIHIPKILNPDNKVYTHNTMDIFVRKKEKDVYGTYKGLYLHRCANRSVTQITHNDIAIPLYILDAYRDYLKTQDITVHVVVRQHDKDNVLIRDKNYIDLLYSLSDQEIFDHLSEKCPNKDMSFWHAKHLEQSVYVEAMFDIPDSITPSNMTYYIEGLGYYHVMSLLTEKIVPAKITEWFDSAYAYPKPYVYQDSLTYPIVYIDGKKVNSELIKYSDYNNTHVIVGFDIERYKPNIGSEMIVEMFVDGNRNVYKLTPKLGESTFIIPYMEFDVLEEIDHDQIAISGFDRSTTKGYKPFTELTGNIIAKTQSDGTVLLTFSPHVYGRTFIIQPTRRVYRYYENINDKIKHGDPLIFDLDVKLYNDIYRVPLLDTPTVLVYLNGRYLTQGVDFTVQEVHDYEDNLCVKVICVHNVSWLDTTDNYIEYFVMSAKEENREFGYAVDGKAHISDNELALYFPQMTSCHVDGMFETNVVTQGNKFIISSDKGYRQGALCELRTSVPDYLSDYLNRYHTNDDIKRIEILNEYFYGIDHGYPDTIILNDSHVCYSIYTATIIRDILNGNIANLSYDPDIERMRDQVKAYQYLAEADLVNQKKYDLRFVDVSPHYRQFAVSTPEERKVLQAFIKLTMPEDDYITNSKNINITAP